ncbi:MAG: hypothetical protein GXP53_05480 [Deltaproteobacteria bacterium]|nr:hypothetical protein [Deltaproteobacteria bacterium]
MESGSGKAGLGMLPESAICNEFACTHEAILRKGKKGNFARDIAIYLSREMTGKSGVALGRYFGISGAGVTVRHGIIAEKINKDRKLNRQVNRIKKTIIKMVTRPYNGRPQDATFVFVFTSSRDPIVFSYP